MTPTKETPMTDMERKLRMALDAMQDVLRELKYELENNFTANGEDLPDSWAELLDACEILGNWDPDAEDGEVRFEAVLS